MLREEILPGITRARVALPEQIQPPWILLPLKMGSLQPSPEISVVKPRSNFGKFSRRVSIFSMRLPKSVYAPYSSYRVIYLAIGYSRKHRSVCRPVTMMQSRTFHGSLVCGHSTVTVIEHEIFIQIHGLPALTRDGKCLQLLQRRIVRYACAITCSVTLLSPPCARNAAVGGIEIFAATSYRGLQRGILQYDGMARVKRGKHIPSIYIAFFFTRLIFR